MASSLRKIVAVFGHFVVAEFVFRLVIGISMLHFWRNLCKYQFFCSFPNGGLAPCDPLFTRSITWTMGSLFADGWRVGSKLLWRVRAREISMIFLSFIFRYLFLSPPWLSSELWLVEWHFQSHRSWIEFIEFRYGWSDRRYFYGIPHSISIFSIACPWSPCTSEIILLCS